MERFICKYCGDKVPVRFGFEVEEGQSVCLECGNFIRFLKSLDREDPVLLTTRYPLFTAYKGFSNVSAVHWSLNMEKIRKDCPYLKEIPLSQEELETVSSCLTKKVEGDPQWNLRYMAYKTLAHRLVKIMEVKTLSDRQFKKEVKDFWKEFEIDYMRNAEGRALVEEKTDFEALKAMMKTVEENI